MGTLRQMAILKDEGVRLTIGIISMFVIPMLLGVLFGVHIGEYLNDKPIVESCSNGIRVAIDGSGYEKILFDENHNPIRCTK